jgi:hypothetical protein
MAISTSEICDDLKLQDINNYDEADQSLQYIGDSAWYRNVPIFIVGNKGNGKSTVMSAICQYASKVDAYRRFFYIYSENVDTKISRALPRDKVIEVTATHAPYLIEKYLRKKMKFLSMYRLLLSLRDVDAMHNVPFDRMRDAGVYWDNKITDIVSSRKKGIFDSTMLVNYGIKTLEKYVQNTVISINDKTYTLGPFSPDDFDLFIMDDLQQFYHTLGTHGGTSEMLKYFTITRQNLINFLMCGQDWLQLPSMCRTQLGNIFMMQVSDMKGIKSFPIPQDVQSLLIKENKYLKKFEGILYDLYTNEIEKKRVKQHPNAYKRDEVAENVVPNGPNETKSERSPINEAEA